MTAVVFVADEIKLSHHAQAEVVGQRDRQRKDDTAFHGVVAETILIGGKLHIRHDGERSRPAVVAPEVELQSRSHIAEAALLLHGARVAVVDADRGIRLKHELQINIVKQAGFQVHGRNRQTLSAHVAPLGVVAVVGIGEHIHLDLEMSGVHGVRTLGFIRTIRAHLPHQNTGRGIEEMIAALVG